MLLLPSTISQMVGLTGIVPAAPLAHVPSGSGVPLTAAGAPLPAISSKPASWPLGMLVAGLLVIALGSGAVIFGSGSALLLVALRPSSAVQPAIATPARQTRIHLTDWLFIASCSPKMCIRFRERMTTHETLLCVLHIDRVDDFF